MDFQKHFEASWQVFTRFLPALLFSTLALMGVSVITLGIMAPVCTAGYMQSLLLALREGRKPEIRDLFSQMRLFFPLLGFSILVVLVVSIGLMALVVPGIVIVLAILYFCVYMVPLMTDREMALFDAIKESSRLALEKPVIEHVVVIAIYAGITSLGNSTLVLALFTQPFATLFILSVFESKAVRQLPPPLGQTAV